MPISLEPSGSCWVVKSHPSCSSPWSFLRLLRPQAGYAEEQWSSTMTMTTSPFGSPAFGPGGCTRQSLGRDIAELAGTASRVDIDTMYRVMGERPNIQRLVRHFTEAAMARHLQSVACNALDTVKARCCRFIVTIHSRINRDTLALTHEFLAERLGVRRTTVRAVMYKAPNERADQVGQRRHHPDGSRWLRSRGLRVLWQGPGSA
jgi:hypothetical protein